MDACVHTENTRDWWGRTRFLWNFHLCLYAIQKTNYNKFNIDVINQVTRKKEQQLQINQYSTSAFFLELKHFVDFMRTFSVERVLKSFGFILWGENKVIHDGVVRVVKQFGAFSCVFQSQVAQCILKVLDTREFNICRILLVWLGTASKKSILNFKFSCTFD